MLLKFVGFLLQLIGMLFTNISHDNAFQVFQDVELYFKSWIIIILIVVTIYIKFFNYTNLCLTNT